ncbi:MAG: hypothetical protein PVF58_18705 [Candidatus Methanofastidiosia archaeon]|jgi:GMP synthase (glutamine-hydrolysing)
MILIVDVNSKKLGYYEFVLPLCDIVGAITEYDIVHYTNICDIHGYEKIIVSGTPLMDNTYISNIKEFEWIKTCNKPVLGICAGMQVIGLVFGSLLIECKEIGMTKVEPVKDNILFSSDFMAYELHKYGINPCKDFEVLAQSKKCIQGIKHKKKDIYGILFHPEVRNKEIINKFIC